MAGKRKRSVPLRTIPDSTDVDSLCGHPGDGSPSTTDADVDAGVIATILSEWEDSGVAGVASNSSSTYSTSNVENVSSTGTPEDRYLEQEILAIRSDLSTESSKILRAIILLHNDKFKALWTKIHFLEAGQDSSKRIEGMVNFLYAWIKGAEEKGIYKLPPRYP